MKKVIVMVFVFLMMFQLVIALDCPFEEVNCEYPGNCGRYVDYNSDGLCDYSEEEQEISLVKSEVIEQAQVKASSKYNFMIIFIITLVAYFLTWFLSWSGKMKLVNHRKIWNFILLISFLISGILGLLLVLRIEYGFNFSFGLNNLFWHVELGIVMVIVSFFHIFWHLNYYKNYLKF